MKRFALIIALLTGIGLSHTTNAQKWYFYESFDNVAVNAMGAGSVPTGFTLYNDDNEPFDGRPDLSYFDEAWKVIRGLDGEGCVSAPSMFKNSQQANRWLITPGIALTGATAPKLYFRAKADDERARDGFVLKISTTSTDSTTFKNIRSIREARETWTDYVFDLTEYAGQTVYVAFVQNSTNMQSISIDDIRVGETASGIAAACNNAFAPLYMIHTAAESPMLFPISATLQNWSASAITSARLCVRLNEGKTVTKTFDGLDIAAAGSASLNKQTFSLNVFPEAVDADASVEIWFDQINGSDAATEHTAVSCFIADESNVPHKKLMFEIFSSAMCSNCGPWNKIFHGWDEAYGGNDINRPDGFVVAKFQVNIPAAGDPLVTSETTARSNFYGVGSAPYWTMNGRRFILHGGENTEQTFENFLDSLRIFQSAISPFALQTRLTIDGETLKAETKTTAQLPAQGKYQLYIVLAEDSIHMNKAQMSEETEFYNVVRKMLPDANGTQLQIPATGETFETAHTYAFGDSQRLYGSLDRVGVIAYIQNTETREIVQAAFASANGEWSKTDTWVYTPDTTTMATEYTTTREAVADAIIYPNPASETATLAFHPLTASTLTISVLDLQGRLHARMTTQGGTDAQALSLPVVGLPTGFYLVTITGADGRTTVKLLKR